jgi:hypothetical protein
MQAGNSYQVQDDESRDAKVAMCLFIDAHGPSRSTEEIRTKFIVQITGTTFLQRTSLHARLAAVLGSANVDCLITPT